MSFVLVCQCLQDNEVFFTCIAIKHNFLFTAKDFRLFKHLFIHFINNLKTAYKPMVTAKKYSNQFEMDGNY